MSINYRNCPEFRKNRELLIKQQLLQFERNYCNCCGKTVFQFKMSRYQESATIEFPFTLTIDHKIPRSKGGNNALDNLQILCNNCNKEKGASYEIQ